MPIDSVDIFTNGDIVEVDILIEAQPLAITTIVNQGIAGPPGPPGSAGRGSVSRVVIGTDADIVAVAGKAYFLRDLILTANRNIVTTDLNQEADYIEVCNYETGFQWGFSGQEVYYNDGNIVDPMPVGTNIQIRRIDGKLRILN